MHAALLALLLLAPLSAQQDPDEPPKAPRGWALSNESGALHWTTRAPNAAFQLDAGEALDPRSSANAGRATWEGEIELARSGRYSFEARAQGGRATLELLDAAGKTLAQPIDGRAGSVRARVHFEAGAGAQSLQLVWKLDGSPQGDFGWEPVPARSVALPKELEQDARQGELALRGRVLLEQKGCTNCHLPSDSMAQSVGRRKAPKLPGPGFGKAWVARWIADPASLRPSADMPALPLAGGEAQGLANCLTPDGVSPGGVSNEAAVLVQGRGLYHRLGCVACHGALESPAVVLGSEFLPRETPASLLGDLAGKWQGKALSEFLQHPDARMPSLDLSASEADLLATYLLSRFAPAPAAPQAEVQRPNALKLCAACHEITGVESHPQSKKVLAELAPDRGCLDPRDTQTPRYALTSEERTALHLGLAAVKLASGAPAPLDAAERTFQKLRCGACHARDGSGGPAEELRPYFVATDERVDIGDEGRIPPDLSGVGFKLTTHWLGQVLLHAGRARPYLATRMPQFGEESVGALVRDLARREGVTPEHDATEPVATDARVQAGRALMGRGAHGCISCHLFKDAPPAGTPGVRLDQLAERLRYEWYAAYMPDAARYKRGTKMPSFQTKGVSAVKNVLAGDFHAQSEAIWSYLTLGSSMPPPPDLELGRRGLRVTIGERPVVLRAFLTGLGPRAIAVGMPSGLHFAYDAGAVRLAQAWKGDFLDASGAWAGRGGTELGGLGEKVWDAPPGALLSLPGPDAPVAHFEGYELDAQGLPSFLWSLGKIEVRETIRTMLVPQPTLRRELRITRLEPGGELLVNAGMGVDPLELHGAGLARRVRGLAALHVLANEVSFTLEVHP